MRLLLTAAMSTLAAGSAVASEASISIDIPRLNVAEYHRPYVAFWLESEDGGKITNNNLGDYKMPSVKDIPELKTVLVKTTGGVGPLDSKPIGEFANNAPPAAIANAIADAVGVRLFELPLKAEAVYQALKRR